MQEGIGIIAVVAGSYQQFKYWCRENCISSKRKDVAYVSSCRLLYGLHPGMVVYCGTYYERKDMDEIEAIITRSCPDLIDGKEL